MSRFSVTPNGDGFGIWDSSEREFTRYGHGPKIAEVCAYATEAKAQNECDALNECEREKED